MAEIQKSPFRSRIEHAYAEAVSLPDSIYAQPGATLYRDVAATRKLIPMNATLPFQEKSLAAEILANRHPILFFEEEQIEQFETKRRTINGKIFTVNQQTGLQFGQMPEPIIITYDSKRQRINVLATIERYKNSPEVIGQLGAVLGKASLVAANQMGKFYTDIFANLREVFPRLQIDNKHEQRIKKSAFFVDKTRYIDLRNSLNMQDNLPPLAPSTTLAAKDIVAMESLKSLIDKFQGSFPQNSSINEIVIKIGLDSGGEGVFITSEENFADVQMRLRRDIANFEQYAPEETLRCIVQEKVYLSESSDFPLRTSVDFAISGPYQIAIAGTAGQISRDPEKKGYIGSIWRNSDEKKVIESIGEHRLINQAKLIAEKQYIGPIGFDYMWDASKNEYVDIGDLNPRDTANILVYTMRNSLIQMGQSIHSLANIGSTGMFHTENLSKILEVLQEENLLYTTSSQSGIILLPYIGGGYNPFFVNFNNLEELSNLCSKLQEFDHTLSTVYL